MTGMGRAVYLYLKGLWWVSGGANGRESDRTGRVESQQVVEGRGIYKCECRWDHYCVLSGCLLLLSLCCSGFQDLLRLNPISVDVVWMHLNFDGFSDETIHVAGLCREEFSVL